ncbi:MAG: hypothetical protein AABZ39_06350 [Spirochaetota bacterium]
MYKRLIPFIIIALVSFNACSRSASIDAMRDRLSHFRRILPADISDSFNINSKQYGAQYAAWQKEYYAWQKDILDRERRNQSNVERTYYAVNQELYTLSMLTNRFYEREIPTELMRRVRVSSDTIAQRMNAALARNPKLAADLMRVKADEAIHHFTVEEVSFYFLWNYVITLERYRRFQ